MDMDQLDLVAMRALIMGLLAQLTHEQVQDAERIAREIVGENVNQRAVIAHMINVAHGAIEKRA
jgi:hypothetical protein